MSRENAMSARLPRRPIRLATLGLGLVGAGVFAAVLWSATGSARAATAGSRGGAQFSAYIDDLPIMPGLAENDEGYVFDLFQGGRLAEARLAGDADAAAVRGFYAATLTQLGWRPTDAEPYVYHRGGERLTFLVEARRARKGARAPKGLEAVFVITPAAADPAPSL